MEKQGLLNVLYRHLRGHDWEGVSSNVTRIVVLYLMVGFIFLSSTSLEPFACEVNLDGREYMISAPDIACDWCDPDYKVLRTMAYIGITLYGIGSLGLFYLVLHSYRNELKTNEVSDWLKRVK